MHFQLKKVYSGNLCCRILSCIAQNKTKHDVVRLDDVRSFRCRRVKVEISNILCCSNKLFCDNKINRFVTTNQLQKTQH
jgi:hypothetical protein